MDGILLNVDMPVNPAIQAGQGEALPMQPPEESSIDLASIKPKARLDLRLQRTDDGSPFPHSESSELQARWTLFDPITRQSYRIGIVEHWLLTRADGKASGKQLIERCMHELTCSDQATPAAPATRQMGLSLAGILVRLVQSGLLLASPRSLASMRLASQAESSLVGRWLSSVVVWQIRGLNPDKWLNRLAPHVNFLYSQSAVKFWFGATFLTTLAILLDFHRLSAQTVSLEWIFRPQLGMLLMFAFLVTRGLHELGHAVVCKRFGIRCPDIGLFVILGAPCVYCDVSESWQLPRRWQRAAVAAAGMYTELIVATVAAWIWLMTIEGSVNTLAYQTMLVCSVSTLVINANPLMRFDGYYLLSDWLDEVNLRHTADSILAGAAQRSILGKRALLEKPLLESTAALPNSRGRQRQTLLAAFSLAGWLYRIALSATIAQVLIALYASWNLPWVGRFLAVAILFTWWGVPLVKFTTKLYRLAAQVGRRWRLSILAALGVLLVAALPIPHRNLASGWIQPSEARGVYVNTPSRLVACRVTDGQTVAVGQTLFQLESPEVVRRLVKFDQARQIANIRYDAMGRKMDMYRQEVNLEQAHNSILDAQQRWERTHDEFQNLTLVAPIQGRVWAMPAPSAATPHLHPPLPLKATWCEPQQQGRHLQAGTLLAIVGRDSMLAVLPLQESQLAFIAAGTPVRLRMPFSREVLTSGTVKTVVQLDTLSFPDNPWHERSPSQNWSIHGRSPAGVDARFAAVVEIPSEIRLPPGVTVDAVFFSQATTVATQVYGWLQANLRLIAD